jgi:hypothetical protein
MTMWDAMKHNQQLGRRNKAMTIAQEAEKLANTFGAYKNDLVSQGIAQLASLVERLASEVRVTRPDLDLNKITARAGAYHAATTFATLINSGGGATELKKAFAEVASTFSNLLLIDESGARGQP